MATHNTTQESGTSISTLPLIIFGALSLVFGGVLAWALPMLGVLPPAGSEQAQNTDSLFAILLGIGGVVFFLVQGLVYYAAIAFRAKPNDTTDGPSIHGNTMLEIVWTVIPSIVVVVLAILSFLTWRDNTAPSETPNLINGESIEINAIGQRFAWAFEYNTTAQDLDGEPIVINSSDLFTYVGQDVELEMTTADVIHSFWVPAMRVKQDLLPGRTTTVQFTPVDAGEGWRYAGVLNPVVVYSQMNPESEPVFEIAAPEDGQFPQSHQLELADPNGDLSADWLEVIAPNGQTGYVQQTAVQGVYNRYRLICAELCGGGHGEMYTYLNVYNSEEAYLNAWYTPTVARLTVPPDSPIALGEQVIAAYPCAGCHVLDSLGWAGLSGPNMTGIADRTDGRAAEISGVENGAEYIAQSIRHPQEYLAPGAWAVQMTQFTVDQIPEEDLVAIIAYLCSQTGSGDPAESTCGLESWQFENGALVDVDALVAELTVIAQKYE